MPFHLYQCQSLATPARWNFRHINHIVNADAIAFPVECGQVVNAEVTERVRDRRHSGENNDEDCGNKRRL